MKSEVLILLLIIHFLMYIVVFVTTNAIFLLCTYILFNTASTYKLSFPRLSGLTTAVTITIAKGSPEDEAKITIKKMITEDRTKCI